MAKITVEEFNTLFKDVAKVEDLAITLMQNNKQPYPTISLSDLVAQAKGTSYEIDLNHERHTAKWTSRITLARDMDPADLVSNYASAAEKRALIALYPSNFEDPGYINVHDWSFIATAITGWSDMRYGTMNVPSIILATPDNQNVWEFVERIHSARAFLDSALEAVWFDSDIAALTKCHLAIMLNAWRVVEVSKEDRSQLSFYRTIDDFYSDKRTRSRPGRLLSQMFPFLSQSDLHKLVMVFEKRLSPLEVLFSQDPDEIETVYLKGPSSCMSKGLSHYDSAIHPSRVYAGPDLAVAYDAHYSSRAVVWPDKKIYSRVYGDTDRFTDALESIGYTKGGEDDFQGARLRKIEDGSGYVMPYVDFCDDVDDGGDYWIAGGFEYNCRNTNGLLDYNVTRCDCCGGRINEDYYVVTHIGDIYCSSCADYNLVLCEATGDYFTNDEMVDTPGLDYHLSYHACATPLHRSRYGILECCVSNVFFIADREDYITLADGSHVLNTYEYRVVLCSDEEYRLMEDCTEIGDVWYEDDSMDYYKALAGAEEETEVAA